MVPRHSHGRTAAPRPSRARRTPTGRAAIASRRWCAGPDWCRRAPRSTTSSRRRTGRRRWSPRPASRISRKSCCRAMTRRARTSRFTSTVMTSVTFSPARARTSAANSSTGPTTAILPAFVMISGRRCSWSRRPKGSVSGSSRWFNCVCPCCSICGPIRLSGRSTKSGDYVRWFIEHAFVVVPAQGIVAQHLASFAAISAAAKARLFLGRTGAWRSCAIHRQNN